MGNSSNYLPALSITHKMPYMTMFDDTNAMFLIIDKAPLSVALEAIPGIIARWEISTVAQKKLNITASTKYYMDISILAIQSSSSIQPSGLLIPIAGMKRNGKVIKFPSTPIMCQTYEYKSHYKKTV